MELTKALFTLIADGLSASTHKNGDFGANSVTERRYTAAISRVESHLSDRCSYSDTG